MNIYKCNKCKKTIEETTRLMINGTLTKEEADKILLALHNVSDSLKMLVEQMEFIPEEPYLSDVISWEKGNIWELHELFPDTKNIEIRVNKNYR